MTEQKYKITVTRGQFRTTWGSGYTKEKAQGIIEEMIGEKWRKGRLISSIYSFKNPRIKKA